MSDVFISYARSTAREAQAIGDALRALGYSVWRDDDLPSHRSYSDVIEEQLDLAKAVVVVWPNEAVRSQWVRSEADRARSHDKLVQLAVLQSARITDGEIAKVANSRMSPQEVLQYIYNNRQLMKNYQIKVNLINNPKTPVGVSMRFLSSLRMAEVKSVAKNRNVPQGLATAAKKMVEKKGGID